MIKFLILLFGFVFYLGDAADCVVPISPTCDASTLACCDDQLKATWNLDCRGKHIYEQPDCVDPILDAFVNKSGALKTCDAFNKFRSCLGQTARSCTTLKHFLENQAPPALARSNEALYGRLSYICGAGLDSFLRNIEKMTSMFEQNGREISLCAFEFRHNSRNFPARACEYLQRYTSCYQKIFADYPEMEWTMCETARAYGNAFAPHCTIGCTSTP